MNDIIKDARRLAELKVPPLRAEITVHEDEDPRYTDDCLVQIVEKDDEYSIWYEEEHGGYEHGKLHFAHVFAAAPELAQALAEEAYEYSFQVQNTIDMWEHPSCAGEPDRWWDTESEAEEAALAAHEYGYPIRIVRRRVSTVEVINE